MPSVCIHAHFYQPSRENPWTGQWEDQPSAAPYANWNERISDECYAANGAARLLDATGKTRGVRNTYLDLNFDVGPTLMRWLECNRPAVYQTILQADQTIAQRLDGAGPAIAQGYHHAILPLCDSQDRRTELAWGLRDFENRFGRPARGLWLPETAVDLPTLCEAAQQGVRFVILAPHQAEAIRPLNGEWEDTDERHWTQRAYTIALPDGGTMAAFFYDGALARGVAFDGWLHDGEHLAEQLIQAGHGDGLVHLATDGESYGHHHLRGEMALARAAECIERTSGVSLTTYEAYLREHPPEWEARLLTPSSWSCSHGVERWRSDCGCKMDPSADTHQRWRTQLRDAFDALRDDARKAMTSSLKQVFVCPNAARLTYVDVIYDRGSTWQKWCVQHLRTGQRPELARRLMEIERHLLAMYTSCGWFFDDVTGIEARQNIRHGACAIQKLQQCLNVDLSQGFLERIQAIEANAEAEALHADLYDWLNRPTTRPTGNTQPFSRQAGTVLHITSLPGDGPIGDLDGAAGFVDWLESTGISVWQILPTSPPGYGASPYSSWSSFSGNPWLVGLKPLVEAGLLAPYTPWTGDPRRTDFEQVEQWKQPKLEAAAALFLTTPDHPWWPEYRAFLARADWLDDAALFWALKKHHGGRPWWQWSEPLRNRAPTALAQARKTHASAMASWSVLEFFFDRQWQALRTHCAARGVELLGDLPIYVGEDSVDVWAHRDGFQVDKAGQFLHVAGVPPDPYCEDGQRWGNPLYDWEAMAESGFEWWIRRARRAFSLTDSVRIDHFIGICRYWSIPAEAETARDGVWREGPGQALFDALTHALGPLPLVVEDLGPIDPKTRALQERLAMPGMRVVQFGFGSGPDNEHLPHNAPELSLLYTSTHDSDTTRGWWDGLPSSIRAEVAPEDPNQPVNALIHRVLASPAIWAMVPIQDWLGADSTARFNTPGTAHGNWRWRVLGTQLTEGLATQIGNIISTTQREHPRSHRQQPFTLTASQPMRVSTTSSPSIAYFCMEFGLHQDFPIYAGGLGVLAGDILKAAGDQKRPFVGVGIFWNHGYTVQTLDESGTPVDTFIPTSRDALEPTGVEVTVTIRGRDVPITAHRVTAFNNATLYLVEPIDPADQWVSKWLYGGSDDDRVAQEVLLGIGGVRVLQALGHPVDLYHFNEGHALFAGLELIGQAMAEGLTYEAAKQAVKAKVVFTTHTPVPAGNEVHPIDRLIEQGAAVGGLTREQLTALGGDPFEMTPAALRLSRSANAVANLHGETARKMWAEVAGAAPIHSVTNGVHLPTWQDARLAALKHGDPDALWARHLDLKRQLIQAIKVMNGVHLDEDVLLIGFARRAATYKRATLVLRDLEWLAPLITANKIQIVFSGKAHPKDEDGKALVREIAKMAEEYPQHIVFLQNYGMELGALLTRGCDVWLNTPRRPQEASGTSGMKAAANGLLNVSILDGWWAEGCDHGENGWQFGDGFEGEGADTHDEEALHAILDQAVLPTFYDDRARWIQMMSAAIQTAEDRFSAAGMLARYDEVLYRLD